MSDDYIPLQDRINSCRVLISELGAEVRSFFENAIDVQTPAGDNKDTHHVVVFLTQELPAGITVKAGAIANELRSCLDALACRLAVDNGKSLSNVYFPIFSSLEAFEKDDRKRMQKFSDTVKRTIANITPYGGGHPVLFGLHEADRLRKHRGLIRSKCRNKSVQAKIGSGHSIHAQGNSTITIGKVTRPDGRIDRNVGVCSGVLLEEVGDGYMVSSNVLYGAPVKLMYSVYYHAPEAIKGRDVVNFLNEAADAVESVISLF